MRAKIFLWSMSFLLLLMTISVFLAWGQNTAPAAITGIEIVKDPGGEPAKNLALLSEPVVWLQNVTGSLCKEVGLGYGPFEVLDSIEPWDITIIAGDTLGSDDSVLVQIKGQRSVGLGTKIDYQDTLISGTRMDIPRLGEQVPGMPYHTLSLQPAASLAGTVNGDISRIYILRSTGLEIVSGKYVRSYLKMPITYEAIKPDTEWDTVGYGAGVVACTPMDGRFRDITLFIDATSPGVSTGTRLGLGYMLSADGTTYYGPTSGDFQDSTYYVDSLIAGIRDKPFFMRVNHRRDRWIKFLFYGEAPAQRTILKEVKATKKN